MSRKMTVNILSILLAISFIVFSAQKIGAENIVFETLAARSGIDLFEPLLRKITGIMELVTAIFLLNPKLRVKLFAALMGLGILSGAIMLHLSPWLGINVPGIGHFLFISALAMFALLLALLWQIKLLAGEP